MSGPAYVPQEIWAGSDLPSLVWGFGEVGASAIPAGAQFRLEIGWMGSRLAAVGSLAATSPDGGLTVDSDQGDVTWAYTRDQSLLIPRGTIVTYQLFCLHAGAEAWAFGPIVMRGVLPLTAA